MKTVKFFLLLIAAITITGCSSTKQVSEADIIMHKIAVQKLDERQFMIKVNRLVLDKHSLPSVNPITNFILVNGDEAIVQISPSIGTGANGVGGFTVKGSVSQYEVTTKSNGEINVRYNVTATPGSCSVFISLPKDSKRAVATIQSTFHGKRATIYGEISEIDNTIYVGRTR